MACPDLCTAAKCEELEQRIKALEEALEKHKQQDIVTKNIDKYDIDYF